MTSATAKGRFRRMASEDRVMIIAGVVTFVLAAAVLASFLLGPDPLTTETKVFYGPAEGEQLSAGQEEAIGRGMTIVIGTLFVLFMGLTGFFWYKLLKRDRPSFDELAPEEQQRLHEAGGLLALGVAGAPTVANTVATRDGRRRGRQAARESRRARRHRY